MQEYVIQDVNYSSDYGSDCGIIILIVVLFLFLFIGIGCGCWYYKYPEDFASLYLGNSPLESNLGGRMYNALYTSPDHKSPGSYLYTQPPGDTKAQAYGRSGQGTGGEFLPLQGVGAGVYMKNSSVDNLALPSPNAGKIGGQPNYTKQRYSSRWVGFNGFGSPFDLQKGPDVKDENYSNSYTISGGNERVCNSGQKCDNLRCQDWWPTVKKGSHGFCTQGSDAMVPCKTENLLGEPNRNVNSCKGQGANRFLRDKMGARWKKVINP